MTPRRASAASARLGAAASAGATAASGMKVVATPEAVEFVRRRGGQMWVWLDPHRSLVGGYVYLEAATEPPGTSRRTRFTRSSRRPHRFALTAAEGLRVHADWGHLEPPDELHVDVRGWLNKRIEAYWNGCVFAGSDVPPRTRPAT